MKLRRSVLILALILTACGQAPATTPVDTVATTTAPSAAAGQTEEHGHDQALDPNDPASTLVTLDLMRGHLISSIENAKIQDYTFAQQHAVHPFAEHYAQIKPQVQQAAATLDTQLDAAFTTYQQQLETKAEIATLEQSTAAITTLLSAIEQKLVPDATDLHGRAIAGVIATAAEEYQESIQDGAFVAPIEYQDAFGFVRSATARFATAKTSLDAGAAAATQAALETLSAAMPSVSVPKTVLKPVGDVVVAAHAVEEELGLAQAAGSDTASLNTGLTRLANEVLGAIDTAIEKNDVAAARTAWETFDAGWGAIESGVRERSKESYRAIENAMDEVEDAVVRTEKPVAADVTARTSALRAEIEKFVSTLK